MSYPMIEIGELMLKRNGSVDPSKFVDETFELHSIPAFDRGFPDIVKGSEIGSSKQLVQENDVMISKIVPHIRRASVVCKKGNFRQIASGEWIVFRSDKIYPDYLKHVLISDIFNKQFMSTVSGVGGSLLRARPAFVSKIKIPLPSIEEQRRIASILDKAEELRQKRQHTIEKLDQLLQATFIDMFGDPVSNPKGWELLPSKNVLKIQGGYAFPSTDFSNIGIPVVKIGNANKLGFNTEKFDFIIPKHPEKLTQYELRSGDLLMSLTGTVGKDDYGNITEVTDDYDMYYLNQRVAKLDVINALFSKNYIRYFFSQPSIKGLITKNNRGVRQANISNSDIYELNIPLPTKEVLAKFDSCIKLINEMKLCFKTQLSYSNRLFNSLQDQAFSGNL